MRRGFIVFFNGIFYLNGAELGIFPEYFLFRSVEVFGRRAHLGLDGRAWTRTAA
jgi:hypothetical protein